MSNSAIDLQNIPPPDIVEELSFETVLAEMLAEFRARNPEYTSVVESDPVYKAFEVFAYRETLIRQRVNNAARAVMLSSATGGDLDQIAGNYDVERLPAATVTISGGGGAGATAEAVVVDGVIQAITVTATGAGYTSAPTVAITGLGTGASATAQISGGVVSAIALSGGGSGYVTESDDSLRLRTQYALEGITTAGSEGSYIFHSRSADIRVKDVGVYGPPDEPGNVYVTVLSTSGSGIASGDLLSKVTAALNKEDVRPLTDNVIVQSAQITEYQVIAELKFYNGPDRGVVLAKARQTLKAYIAKMHAVGRDIARSGIYACLHQEGVSRVILATPSNDVVIPWTHAGYCISNIDVSVTDGGIGE